MSLPDRIIGLLADHGPMTARQMHEHMSAYHLKTIKVQLAKMWMVHIADYIPGYKGSFQAIYKLGEGLDAKNPKGTQPKNVEYRFPVQGLTVWQPVTPWITQ